MARMMRTVENRSVINKKHDALSVGFTPIIYPGLAGFTQARTEQKSACSCGGYCPACQARLPIQAKLKISSPKDKYEQEADKIAEKVVNSEDWYAEPGSILAQGSPNSCYRDVSEIQRQRDTESDDVDFQEADSAMDHNERLRIIDVIMGIDETEENNEVVQAKLNSSEEASAYSESGLSLDKLSSGRSLPESTQNYFTRRLGHDFSRVRIHADEKAADIAQSINARAFTFGDDVVFNKGEYSPYSYGGMRLLAHELTHVIQQSDKIGSYIQRQSGRSRRRSSSRIPGMTPSKSTSFFRDLNKIINGLSASASNLSMSDYTIHSPTKYVDWAAKSTNPDIQADYTASLRQARQACGSPLSQLCGNKRSCISTVKSYRSNRQYCHGSKPTKLSISHFLTNRGYTSSLGGRSVIIQEANLDKTLFLLVHEGIHRMAGKHWKYRSNPKSGIHFTHSLTKANLFPLEDEVDEGATQILALQVVKQMQNISGRNWFKNFTSTSYSNAVTRVSNILSKHRKNVAFLQQAYFSNTSYRGVEDIQLWQ